jgi:hypothetical protein
MIKHFCDECGKELNDYHIYDICVRYRGNAITDKHFGGDYCIECIEKIIRRFGGE